MAIPTETLDDAQRLLDFISRKGIHLDGNEIRAIVELESSAAGGAKAEPDSVVKFWEAFAKLCGSARPATLTMIKTGVPIEEHSPWWSGARRGFFPIAGLVLFAAVAAAQVYVGVGTRLVTKLTEERVGYAEKNTNLARILQTGQALSGVAEKTDGDQRKTVEAQVARAQQEAEDLFAQIGAQQTRIELYLTRLSRWNGAWMIVASWLRHPIAKLAAVASAGGIAEANADDSRGGGSDGSRRDQAGAPSQHAPAPATEAKDASGDASVDREPGNDGASMDLWKTHSGPEYQQASALLDAGTVLDAFQSLILPFLYGALGSCVLLLKRHSEEIADNISSPRFTYRVRLALGCMAGVAIGWVVTLVVPEDAQTLAPQTLAFLAGYNVEMLAAALDKVSFR